MKCSQCGCTDFVSAKEVYAKVDTSCWDGGSVKDTSEVFLMNKDIRNERDDLAWQPNQYRTSTYFVNNGEIRAYVCKKCGHIEFFCDTYLKEEQEKREAEERLKEKAIKIEKAKKDLAVQESKLEELNKKTSDENITVKQQKDYLKE